MGEGTAAAEMWGQTVRPLPSPPFPPCPPPWLAGGGGIWGLRYLPHAMVVPLLLAKD